MSGYPSSSCWSSAECGGGERECGCGVGDTEERRPVAVAYTFLPKREIALIASTYGLILVGMCESTELSAEESHAVDEREDEGDREEDAAGGGEEEAEPE